MGVVGLSPLLGAISALIVWAAHFIVAYGAQATACARGAEGETLFGQPLVPAMVLGVTAVALLLVGVIGVRAAFRLRSGMAGQEGEDPPQFTLWMTAAAALLAALAIFWETVPVLILPPCA